VDLIEIGRIRRALERHGDGFRERCFTEAVGKALGSGVYFTWKEIEIRGRPKPGVYLSGRTAEWAKKVNAGRIELSMTHSRELAAAVAVVVDEA